MVNLANLITVGRILAIPLFVGALFLPVSYAKGIAALVFSLLAATDAVDGWVARRRNEQTRTGAILDPLADKLLISAALIFLIGKGIDIWMAFVIIAREFIITGLRLVSEKSIHAGILGKVKTVSQIAGILAVLVGLPSAWYLMLFATIMTLVSGLNYLWQSRTVLKRLML